MTTTNDSDFTLPLKKYYITFGHGQHQPGRDLTKHYTIVRAKSYFDAIGQIRAIRGSHYGFIYRTPSACGVKRFALTYIKLASVLPQIGPTR